MSQDEGVAHKTEAPKSEPKYDDTFSGPIIELSAEKITVSRSILGKPAEKRTFWIKPDTRIEGKLKVKVQGDGRVRNLGRWRRGAARRRKIDATAASRKEVDHFFFFRLEAQPSFTTCRSRPSANASGGTRIGDYRARRDVASVADLDRSNQSGIASDEGVIADPRPVFAYAVVVAGDGSGSNVGALADFSIAQISEMVRFGACGELCILQLHEISDAGVGANAGAAPQPRERSDVGVGFNMRIGDRGEGRYVDASRESGILDDGARADAAVLADFGPAEYLRERLDDGVGSDASRTHRCSLFPVFRWSRRPASVPGPCARETSCRRPPAQRAC